jgi:hypothetical protein
MAKARPSLSVQAQPVSTFVAPANVGAAAVELYDQQTVNLALMFADAFKDLSLTAAKFAGAMKQESNEEEVQRGMDLVNQSQKSYMQLVQSGEIKPGENPWMAVGAQKASGTMEGLRARAHFMSVYEKRAQEDSNFFNGPESFSALASQYAENVNSVIGTTPYMSRAFYESFNPFIASMALKHEENVLKEQERKVTLGVGAAVSQAVQDLGSGDPIIQNMAVSSLQEIIDDMRNSGYNGKQVNEAAVDYLVKEMIDGPQPEQAESILNSLKAGTGSLAETEYAKTVLLTKRGDIQRARDRMTMEESQQFSTDAKQIVAAVVSGKMTEEEAMKWADDYLRSPDRKITVSPSEAESKIGWIQGSIKSAQRDAEIKREQETDNRLMGQIESLSMVSEVEASLSPQDFVAKRRKEFEAGLEGLEPRKRIQYRALFDKTAEEKAEQIELARASQLVESVWMGNGVTQGIVPNLSESAVGFMNNPQANPPDFLRYKNQLDAARSGLGIAPDSEKAKQLYRQDYTRMDRVFTAIEQSRASVFADKTLQPGASDGPEVKAAKATERAKIRFMRMQAGMVFGDDREVQKNIQGYILALNPQNVETSATLTEVEDTLTSFMLAMKNRMPLETVIPNPTSTNSKFLIKELQWAYGQYSAGVPLMDIARDMSQRRGFAQQMNIDPYDPLGWLNFTGGDGKDAAMFNANFTDFLESNGITQSDSRLYAAKVFWDSSFAHLGTDSIGNMKKANQQAAEEVLQKTLKVRGSLIPRAQLNEAIDSNYVEAWLDAKGYPSDTTLVVVDMNPDGSALLAPRNPAGESVPNAVLIRSTELNTVGPEIIKNFKKALDTRPRLVPTNPMNRIPGVYYPY